MQNKFEMPLINRLEIVFRQLGIESSPKANSNSDNLFSEIVVKRHNKDSQNQKLSKNVCRRRKSGLKKRSRSELRSVPNLSFERVDMKEHCLLIKHQTANAHKRL